MIYYVQTIKNGQHFKKNDIEFDYISPKTFKEIKEMQGFTVIGSIHLSEVKTQNTDLLCINNHSFEIEPNINESKILGYISVGDMKFVAVYKQANIIIPIIVLFSYIALIFIELNTYKSLTTTNGNVSENNNQLEFENGDDWNGDLPSNGEQSETNSKSIKIPGYSSLYVSTKNPNITLINPGENDVYFVYTISKDDKVIYETKAIAPNKMIYVNFKDLLSVGEYDLVFTISTYDTETQSPCNGASQLVKITVKE